MRTAPGPSPQPQRDPPGPAPEARLQDQDAPGGDPPGLAEQHRGFVGIAQHEGEQARVEDAIGKGQPGAIDQDGPTPTTWKSTTSASVHVCAPRARRASAL